MMESQTIDMVNDDDLHGAHIVVVVVFVGLGVAVLAGDGEADLHPALVAPSGAPSAAICASHQRRQQKKRQQRPRAHHCICKKVNL